MIRGVILACAILAALPSVSDVEDLSPSGAGSVRWNEAKITEILDADTVLAANRVIGHLDNDLVRAFLGGLSRSECQRAR